MLPMPGGDSPALPASQEAVGNALAGGADAPSLDPMALIQMLLESGQITPEQIPQVLQMLGGQDAPPMPME